MGSMVSYIVCPECGHAKAEEKLRNNLEEKEIICPICGFYKEYVRSDEWIEV